MEMTILSAGPLTSVQDRGRFGYMHYGITTSGVLDDKAYASGNALLGNQAGDACLEMTLKGATIEFHGSGAVAVVGADMMPHVNGDPVAMNRDLPKPDCVPICVWKAVWMFRWCMEADPQI